MSCRLRPSRRAAVGGLVDNAASSSTSEIVVDNPRTTTPRYERILAAGFLHREGGRDGLLGTNCTDCTTETLRDGVYQDS
jgi:hypothetical protein